MSLDFVSIPERQAHIITGEGKEKRNMMKENKYKQPNSPGTRLASFLNSLFNQARKKKSKSKSINTGIKDEEEKERRRRSSISHFGTSNTRIDVDYYAPKSVFSYSSSGFRTPPVCGHTSTKIFYKDCISDHKQFRNEKVLKDSSNNVGNWKDVYGGYRNKGMKKENVKDDEYDSDSSSDLFELQNYDLGVYSSSGGSLPVYETTRRSITRGGISSATASASAL